MQSHVDHLVVMAEDLAQGVAWCEATLGVTPGPGGRHDFMGTHNRLVSIASSDYPLAYLEIIAIDPQAPAPARRRWFDMDEAALRARVAAQGPQLTHFVARVPDATAATLAWQALGLDRGTVVPASRETAQGRLHWKITLREDGQRLLDGTLPTLLEWGPVHPAAAMADAGVRLESLQVQHPQARLLHSACAAIGLAGVEVREGPARLCATLHTPRGRVQLS